METEHRARYRWAGAWVEGMRVLDAGCGLGYGSAMLAERSPASLVGLDLSAEALERARQELGEAVQLVTGDIRELPFESDSFDLVVCFEVIEHVERQERALAELRRVLAPQGTLLISSPNREVYTPGNPHHVHEYVPSEFRSTLEEQFEHVTLYRQHPWLATAILREGGGAGLVSLQAATPDAAHVEGRETYTLAVASDVADDGRGELVELGDDFEVRWWHEQLDNATLERERASRETERVVEELRVASARLVEAEAQAAAALELRNQLERLEQREQELLQQISWSAATIDDMTASPSWKITAPLRAFKRLLRPRGR